MGSDLIPFNVSWSVCVFGWRLELQDCVQKPHSSKRQVCPNRIQLRWCHLITARESSAPYHHTQRWWGLNESKSVCGGWLHDRFFCVYSWVLLPTLVANVTTRRKAFTIMRASADTRVFLHLSPLLVFLGLWPRWCLLCASSHHGEPDGVPHGGLQWGSAARLAGVALEENQSKSPAASSSSWW